MRITIILLIAALCSCSSKQEMVPTKGLVQADILKENIKLMEHKLTNITLLHHIYLIEGGNIKDERLLKAIEHALDQNYASADSILKYTKEDAIRIMTNQ